ncbi:phosphomannomutase/phosphoglucomutase [Kribbella qitaiheensis]|uniref:Phosphomannomutase/phosphoglucomutase n=1 Tax=Kribbella qitaiheensis TaxID=1544730 RepID=A0A7G6WW74_9ACTN|nr:phosphomannomutase/phosphoglucomutase [Kribbella qitaiheensis]QNE18239.1 phosphomannomutase/phosphoglucomutase [Kribbella qitaiheensis]
MRDLTGLIKAYDIRGTVPDQLDAELTFQIGAAFAHLTGAELITVGQDMRESSPELAAAFAAGANSRGSDVLDIGLASTDLLYYASGTRDVPGAMITASHNPAGYNGIKLCRAAAAPVGQDTGLAEIRTLLETGLPAYDGPAGTTRSEDLLQPYAGYLHSLVNLAGSRPLKIVVDAGNGMAGHTAPAVLDHPAFEIVPLYFELDGTFPNHEANPLEPANLVDLCAAVREHRADVGLAFDGDADRCFFVDENGEAVSPSAVVSLIATRELARHPGAAIVYNVITSKAVAELVTEHGGKPIRTRVGHSFIKQVMAEHDAVFGGEHSGHYYFREFWRADTGMLAALHVLAALGETDQPLSALAGQFSRYTASGEINSTISDVPAVLDRVEAHYTADGAAADRLDGLTITLPEGAWFNLRPSNTEPLLRLNVEASDQPRMTKIRQDVLAMLGS